MWDVQGGTIELAREGEQIKRNRVIAAESGPLLLCRQLCVLEGSGDVSPGQQVAEQWTCHTNSMSFCVKVPVLIMTMSKKACEDRESSTKTGGG